MKTIAEIRRERLSQLARSLGGNKKLSEHLDKSPSQVSQWIKGAKDSKTGKPRGLNDATAREIEEKCGKQRGWLDQDSGNLESKDVNQHQQTDGSMLKSPSPTYNLTEGNAPEIKGYIPLISWVKAGAWEDPVDNFQPGSADEWLPCPNNCNPETTFALQISGGSMDDGGSEGYRDGEYVYVDGSVTDPAHNIDVIVKNGDGKATFKRLVNDNGRWYLKPLNPRWPEPVIELDEHCHIVGKIMFSGKKR